MSRPLRHDETFAIGSRPWDNLPSNTNWLPISALLDPSDPKGIS
jgi:hypothetical protein